MYKVLGIYLTVTTLLVACGNEDKPVTSDKQKSALEKTIAPQLDALEKAQGVEDSLQQSVDERDKKMREKGI